MKAKFPEDFLERTREIINLYDGLSDITTLINCCLGLIVIPNDLFIHKLPKYTFNKEKRYGITVSNIIYEKNSDYILSNIVNHIRNGLSHGRIEFVNDENNIIGLKIFDLYTKKGKTLKNFQIEFTVEEYKEFVLELSIDFLKS